MLKVAIIGASGIGKYHVREFHNAGCEIKAILGSSEESVKKTSKLLQDSFGISVKPYHLFDELIQENIDAVSICTPSSLHYFQTKAYLEKDIHVLCEKPFVNEKNNYSAAKELLDLASKKNLKLTVNTQWPSVIPYIKEEIEVKNLEQIKFFMETGLKGLEMLRDYLPHPNSFVLSLMGKGKMRNINFSCKREQETRINFEYAGARIEYQFIFNPERPRKVKFTLNDKEIERKIGENYSQSLIISGKEIPIEDLLKISINSFISSILKNSKPLISKEEILENILMQEMILKQY
jgi:hypothetical protein